MNDFILKVNNVTKKYNGINVLDDVSMSIKRGQIYGFIGLNGAGKSTLMRIVTGLAS